MKNINKFEAIKDYINSRGIGNLITYDEIIIASQVKALFNRNSDTIYKYCRVLRALGYLYKFDRHKLYISKLIPEDKSYNKLLKEYLEKISYPPCYKPIKD